MRRIAMASALLAALALGACGGGGDTKSTTTPGTSSGATAASHTPVTITLWNGFTNRELGVVKQAVAAFHQSHPWITVKVVGGVNDDKIIAAIRGGNSPDVAQSFTADNTGAVLLLGRLDRPQALHGRGQDRREHVPAGGADVHAVQGQALRAADARRHLRPLLQQGRSSRRPGSPRRRRRCPSSTADAKKLTVEPDGDSFKVVGFDPAQGFYENAPAHYGPDVRRASGSTAATSRSLAKQPGWAEFMTWQKGLIDFYGYDKLARWQAGAGDEFSASNAFERGKLAMAIDGEYRTAFIKAEHPDLNYGTAPLPVADSQPELYGSGYVTGNIVGHPQGRPSTRTPRGSL